MSLEQNMNAIYEYPRVLSSRQVNPLIIPPDSLRKIFGTCERGHEKEPKTTITRGSKHHDMELLLNNESYPHSHG